MDFGLVVLNFFKTKNGDWFTCFFGVDIQSPWRKKLVIIKIEFDKLGVIKVSNKQPSFILNQNK
jgi:hypothetical protein